jgi:hypothetical protein
VTSFCKYKILRFIIWMLVFLMWDDLIVKKINNNWVLLLILYIYSYHWSSITKVK